MKAIAAHGTVDTQTQSLRATLSTAAAQFGCADCVCGSADVVIACESCGSYWPN
jgi:hypothetical protein